LSDLAKVTNGSHDQAVDDRALLRREEPLGDLKVGHHTLKVAAGRHGHHPQPTAQSAIDYTELLTDLGKAAHAFSELPLLLRQVEPARLSFDVPKDPAPFVQLMRALIVEP
jgi:hypothetical protein